MITKPPRRRRLTLQATIIIIGALIASALLLSRPAPERITTPRLAPLVTATVMTPRSTPLVVEGTGTVRPAAEITLSAEVGGRVVVVSPKLVRGGVFSAKDTLFKLDDQSYRNAVSVAQAEVEQRKVDVALAAQNQLIAQREYELLKQRLGSDAPPDTSLAAQLARQQPQYEAAEASLYRAEAQLADAELNLERTAVLAPFSGRVRSEAVDIGQFISPGQAVADIYGTEAVEVDVSLSTRQAALIDGLWTDDGAGRTPAVVRSEFGGSWHEWNGFVDRASGALDEATRTVQIVIRVPDPFDASAIRPPLLVGSYTRSRIAGRAVGAHYAIPRTALRDGPSVWTATTQGTLVSLPVEVIQEIQDTVFILADIGDTTRVIVSDLAVMTEGMKIRVADSNDIDTEAASSTITGDATAGVPRRGGL
ncbi:MAG: efflux transporter periplasmic adaptor subunit [Gemmatimonadetes bacterium]|nr:efflux transporter periplasmic adaptor subunit [Gemmatimonadota bacterium]